VSSLGSKAASGVLWYTGLNVFRDFLQFGVMLVLVRLLAPEMYGQFGLVNSIIGFINAFSFRVFLEYILQTRPGGEVDYQLYFTLGAFLQIPLFLLTNITAVLLRYVPKYAPVAPVLHVMSLLFLLDMGNEFRNKMLERAMDWKRLRILQGIGVVANAVTSVLMALAGFGVYALLVPTLLVGIPAVVDLFFVQKWRPTWKWDAAAFAPVRKYGLTRLLSVLVVWTRNLLESTFLVQIVGFAMYGIFGRAVGLAAICCLKIPQLLLQSLFPVLTKLEPGSGASSRANSLVLCSVTWSTFPVAAIFTILAAPVIHTLYGPKWMGSAPFLPWAMASGAATALALAGSQLLIASLQQKKGLYIDGINLVGVALSLVILAPQSLKWYLAGTAAAQTAAFLLSVVWLYRLGGIELQGIVSSLIAPATSVAVSYLAVEFAHPYLAISKENLLGQIAYGALFCLIYLLLLRLSSGRQCREIVRFLPGSSHLQRWLVLEA